MHHSIDARSTLRAFIRKLERVGGFTTAQGKANLYGGKSYVSLYLRTQASKRPIILSYKSIRAAIQLTYVNRTVTRIDLEQYTKGANSALLGILIEIFGNQGKIHKSPTGLIRLTLCGIRYFFAGADRVKRDLEIAAANGAKYVLMSYAHIRNRKAWKSHLIRLGLKVLLDSGAFTVWQASKKGKGVDPIHLEDYAAFIRSLETDGILQGYFNLDVVGDAAASFKNAEQLRAWGLQPIEVWHVGSQLKDLARMIKEEPPVIAIGGSVGLSEKMRKRKFRWLFKLWPNQNFHYLGGSSKLLNVFPWFSADSCGWAVGRRYGAIIDHKGQRKAPEGMNGLDALAYNVRYLAGLERPWQEAS